MQRYAFFIAMLCISMLMGCAGSTKSSDAQFKLTARDVHSLTVTETKLGPTVNIGLSPAKRTELQVLTSLAVGKTINVMVDAQVVSTPLVVKPINSTYIQISCDSMAKAQRIVDALSRP